MLKPPKMDDPRTYEIIGAAMEVHREFGPGFLEGVYQDALEIEFQLRSIPYEREKAIVIKYKGQPLNHRYRADFVCYDEILVETKALKQLTSMDVAQTLHYLHATGLKLGLLINFGAPSLEHRRFANDKNKTKQI